MERECQVALTKDLTEGHMIASSWKARNCSGASSRPHTELRKRTVREFPDSQRTDLICRRHRIDLPLKGFYLSLRPPPAARAILNTGGSRQPGIPHSAQLRGWNSDEKLWNRELGGEQNRLTCTDTWDITQRPQVPCRAENCTCVHACKNLQSRICARPAPYALHQGESLQIHVTSADPGAVHWKHALFTCFSDSPLWVELYIVFQARNKCWLALSHFLHE